MAMGFHSPVDIQKMCHLDTRKLVFLIILTSVAVIVFMLQFLSFPYGSVPLIVFPSEKSPLLAQSEHKAADSSPEAEVLFGISLSNASISSNSSSIGEDVNAADQRKGMEGVGDDGSEVDEDFDPETEVSLEEVIQFGDLEQSQDSSGSKNVSFDNVQNESNLELVKDQSILSPLHSNLESTSLSADANISSIGEQTKSMMSIDKTPEILGNNQGTSENNSSMTSISVMKDKSDVPTGRGNTRIAFPKTSNSIQKGSIGKQTGRGISNMAPNSVQIELSTPVKSLPDMYILLLKSQTSSLSAIPRWSSLRDKEVLSTKSQIENPPIVKTDRQLYAPLFRNVSMFKRSYELMEQTLKVYTYREGARPIFHEPETKGIYASEGWFMKQMERNRRFSVNDPRKAHLFYLPFSPRRLEQFLYVPGSHSRRNMVAHLKSYLDLISAKYPFWNRTGGADHFLVGCHDWTPHETSQYMNNCIRALCNADVSEGFAIGKDVSLPETMIRQARNPLRELGGKPASERQTLAFFAGGIHGYLRPILLKYWENKDPDMKIYGSMGRGKKNKANYVQNMKSSKYCICAKGFEVNSPRVVEAIFYECVPVIISDNFVPPFFEVLNWEAFAIFVPEKDIPNLKNILLSISAEKYLKLQLNVKRVQQHFLWHTKPAKYDIFHMILHSIWYNRVYQIKAA